MRHLLNKMSPLSRVKQKLPPLSNLSYETHNQLLVLNFDLLYELKHVLLRVNSQIQVVLCL